MLHVHSYRCVDDRGCLFDVGCEEEIIYASTCGCREVAIPGSVQWRTTCGQLCRPNVDAGTFSLATETGDLITLTPLESFSAKP